MYGQSVCCAIDLEQELEGSEVHREALLYVHSTYALVIVLLTNLLLVE